MYTKTIRFDALDLWRDYHRAIGKRIVATNGCFDILTQPIVSCLQKARELGDILIVAVNSDRSWSELKGHDPICSQEERVAVLAALEAVDQVVIFDEPSATKFLSIVRPDVWVKGGNYAYESLDDTEVKTVKVQGGAVVIVPAVAGYSTTRCLDLIDESEEAEVLEDDVPRRDQAPATGDSDSAQRDPGEDAGSVLRAPESLRGERRAPKSPVLPGSAVST